jgi:D-alanyl-D-alanine carboxypeptidase
MRFRLAYAALLFVAALSARADDLASALEAIRAEHNVPALAAIATSADGTIELAAVGVRRFGKPDRVTAADLFHIGSNTKAMTSTMIATLVESGVLKWDTRASDVFRDLHPQFRDMTLTQLLDHSAGLPSFDDLEDFKRAMKWPGTAKERRRRFAIDTLQRAPLYPPGSKHLYSNAGYAIAAAMAEEVTGKSWEELIAERVAKPLSMSFAIGWPARHGASQPWGHTPKSRHRWKPDNPDGAYQVPDIVAPAGDVSIALEEYAKFLRLHLRGLRGDDGLLLRADTIRRMHTGEKFGLGWGLQTIRDLPASVHAGSADTFYAIVVLLPTKTSASPSSRTPPAKTPRQQPRRRCAR